ncbi:MAG: pilus assembly protein PilM [Phycisphaerae bacterium]
MNLRGRKQLAIDWDAQSMRVVQFRARNDKVDVLKAVSVPIPPEVRAEDAEPLGAFLRQALSQAGIRDRRASVDVPRDQVVLNTFNLPATPIEELPAVVHFQVVKELPFSAEAATIDFAVRGTYDPRAAVEVLVAAVRNEVLDYYRNVAKEAGLTIERVGLRPHANLVAFSAGSESVKQGLCLAVDVGPMLTEINIIRQGGLIFSRSASVRIVTDSAAPGPEITDSRISGPAVTDDLVQSSAAREAVASLVLEIARSVASFRQTEPTAQLDRIVVAGATGVEAALAESLHAQFGAHAELYNPATALDLSAQRARELRGFSASIGLALGSQATGPGHFNFLSPKKAVARTAKQSRRMLHVVGVGALLLMSAVLLRSQLLKPYEQKVKSLQDQAWTLKRELDGFEKDKKRYLGVRYVSFHVGAIEKWMARSRPWTADLTAIARAFPSDKEAYAQQISFNDQPAAIEMSLRTSGPTTSAELVSRLKAGGYDATVGTSGESMLKDNFKYTDQVKVLLPEGKAHAPAPDEKRTAAPTTRPGARS